MYEVDGISDIHFKSFPCDFWGGDLCAIVASIASVANDGVKLNLLLLDLLHTLGDLF